MDQVKTQPSIRPQKPSAEISAAIAAGRYVWTELGKQILEEGSAYVNLGEWDVENASANGYIRMTEAGQQFHDEEYNRLIQKISADDKPPQADPSNYFFPDKNLNPEWAIREMQYHQGEADRIAQWLQKGAAG